MRDAGRTSRAGCDSQMIAIDVFAGKGNNAALDRAASKANQMNKLPLFVFLASLVVLAACHRAPHESAQETAAAPVGTAPAPAPAVAAPAATGSVSGQPLPDGKMMPFADVIAAYGSQLPGVTFYFDDQPHPAVDRTIGEYTSNQKTNAFNKTDAEACQWVAFSALKNFQKRAISEGGNAVIKIHSYYKKNELSDPTRYECHVGYAAAGVAFKGTVVKLK
jgi:hypothetical protein